jgi:hypothetical protein
MTPPIKPTNITIEIGPFTSILLAEFILIALKLMGEITITWNLVLIPIYLVVAGAALVTMFSLFRIIKNNINF